MPTVFKAQDVSLSIKEEKLPLTSSISDRKRKEAENWGGNKERGCCLRPWGRLPGQLPEAAVTPEKHSHHGQSQAWPRPGPPWEVGCLPGNSPMGSPAAMRAAHRIVPSSTLAGHGWGRSGLHQSCGRGRLWDSGHLLSLASLSLGRILA